MENYNQVMEAIKQDMASGKPLVQSEQQDLEIINYINKEYTLLEQARAVLALDKSNLEKAIERAHAMYEDVSEESGRTKKLRSQSTGDIYCCFGCGKLFNQQGYARHTTECFIKIESQNEVTGIRPTDSEDGTHIVHCDFYDGSAKTYCKQLKASCVHHSEFNTTTRSKKKENDLVCGCPLSSGNYCSTPRNSCMKHTDWEGVKQANMLILELHYSMKEKQLKYEEKITKIRMTDRRRKN